jgi:phosphate transport system substrate-binding protein
MGIVLVSKSVFLYNQTYLLPNTPDVRIAPFSAKTVQHHRVGCLFFAFPQYLFPYVGAAIAGDFDFFAIASGIVTFLFAITGTVYVARIVNISEPQSKNCGSVFPTIILYSVIPLLLCGFIGLSYYQFRTLYLSPDGNTEKVREEQRRDGIGSDTDLSEYTPFKEGNKLVKIELPTLAIESEHPSIHGAFALYPVYAAAVEATFRNTEGLKFDPEYRGADIKSGTSPAAFESLLHDAGSDMIFMGSLSEKQLQEAKDKGIELVITPIGYEAFIFFVSKVNPVDELSLEQIRNIYSKKTTRWNEVGGKRERILPFQRPEGSGSQTAMQRVMGDVPMASPPKEEFRSGMGGIVADVADYRNYGNALGFSFRYYVEGLFKHGGVKLLKVDGIAPTIENIQNGSYPLIGEIVIISRADNVNPNVPKLTEWFLSPQGQELIKNVGYVPLETGAFAKRGGTQPHLYLIFPNKTTSVACLK